MQTTKKIGTDHLNNLSPQWIEPTAVTLQGKVK